VATRTWIVVPAAGASRRVGGAVPKQYLKLLDRTVLEWSLRALLAHPAVTGGVVVLADGDSEWPRLPASLRESLKTAPGGAERCDSVLNGLRALPVDADDWVLVHDAARPCLAQDDLSRLVAACRDDATGGLLALPIADTLKRSDEEGRVQGTVAREHLWRAQTPQMFRHGALCAALQAARAAGETPGDEATAMERAGHAPLLVEGSPFNIKITRPADLAFAEAVLAAREGSET
jgi:2-C-methyl-D-erythritol 4-phosphate cytidylyltransferase